jgi:hypothetical protein
LASPSGQLVHTLQAVDQAKDYAIGQTTYLTGGTVGFQVTSESGKVHYTFPQRITLGLLYDLMIVSYGDGIRDWKILFQTGVKDELQFGRFMTTVCSGRAEPDTGEVLSYFTHQDYCALILIGTSKHLEHEQGSSRKLWQPQRLGENQPGRKDFRRPDLSCP